MGGISSVSPYLLSLHNEPGRSAILDFFGLAPVRVTAILAPTGTVLDNYHFVNPNALVVIDGRTVEVLDAEGQITDTVLDDFHFISEAMQLQEI